MRRRSATPKLLQSAMLLPRTALVVACVVFIALPIRANLIRHQVDRGSDLEAELGYKLLIQDKHDAWRSGGGDTVLGVAGPAPEYMVKFHATAAGRLKELFELTLSVSRADGFVVQVPLALRTRWNKENEVDVQFLIKKEMINEVVLALRCGLPNGEESYALRLAAYAPGNASAALSPTPRSTLVPGPYHVIRLATLQDTGDEVAELDFKVFKSVEALKEHIAKYPWSEIYFQRWRGPASDPGSHNKFINATDDLKKFCAEHHITLTLSAVEPVY
jgi:hypothetical protein